MRRTIVKIALSLLIAAGFVWLAMRKVAWEEFTQAIQATNPWVLVQYFLLLSFIHLVRVYRWGILLRPLGRIPFGRLFSVGSVGIMALTLLPFRLGEFARPILIAEKGKIRASAALASIVVERVADSLAMTLLLVVILFFLDTRIAVPAEIRWWGWGLLALFVFVLVLLVLAYRYPEKTVRLFRRVFAFLPARLNERLCSMLSAFIGGMRGLPNARLLFEFVLVTIAYWVMNGLGMLLCFGAFSGLMHLGWLEAFTGMAVLCVGLMIPAGPAMIGNFQYFLQLGLSLFVGAEVLAAQGAAYAVVLWAMQVGQQVLFALPFILFGKFSLGWLLIAPRKVKTELEQGTCPPPDPPGP